MPEIVEKPGVVDVPDVVDVIVEVAADVDFDDMDAEDLDADGNCAVDGMYALRICGARAEGLDAVDVALDAFHAKVPISDLDAFTISARRRRASDSDTDLRSDLGSFQADEPLEPEVPDFGA